MTYRIAPAPKFAGMKNWDCTRCGRVEVKPVFLTNGTDTAAYGSGCAAEMLGRPRSAAAKIKTEAASIQHAADQQDAIRAEIATAAQRALAAWSEGARGEADADLERMRRNYCTARQHGKLPEGLLLPAYIAQVAETGHVDPWSVAA